MQLRAAPPLEASKDCYMKKKLLVLLITAASTLMPNLASAIAIDVGDCYENMACAQCVMTDFFGGQMCGCLDSTGLCVSC